MAPSLAFVTPSFPPDLERCALLVESLDRFGAQFTHYIIVDRAHRATFAHLANSRTRLIDSESLIDRRFMRVPWKGGIWLNWQTLPMRGWIAQQVKKIAAAEIAAEDILVMTDSDVTFVRPFGIEEFLIDGKTGLLDVNYCAGLVPTWTKVAARLLGLPAAPRLRGHVAQMIAWRRTHMLGLIERIEATTGLPWQVAIARLRTFSEYITYGVYIREVIGYDISLHAPSQRPLVKQPWDYTLTEAHEMARFFAEIEPENIAVMIHSKHGIPLSAARPHLDKIFASHG